jgi:hypothetical protein
VVSRVSFILFAKLTLLPFFMGRGPVNLSTDTVAALNIELQCSIYRLLSLSLRFWRVQYMRKLNRNVQLQLKAQ